MPVNGINLKHKFRGDIIVTLYEKQFGLYPYYSDSSDLTSAVNGGIPQRANLSAHLSKVRSDIDKAIPNKDFDGLAIIDYEEWRPLWEHNWYTRRIYHNASLAYVEEQYKNTGKTLTKGDELAKKNSIRQQCENFLTETIREAKNMRPNALWEFYGMPFCNYSAGKNGTEGCGEVFEEFNNRLA
uniref:Hyaluronidase n=1 Tax=Loa loa TaxID=7209 RepID=A0A1I7V957_LOALO